MRTNFHHLYADIFWYGILAGSAMAFLAIYITRLGGTSFQISLLTALTAGVNLLLSMPAARWLQGKALIPATTWSAALHRAGYLALIPLPWFLNDQQQIWTVIWITLLMSLPQALLAISFNAMFADVVPLSSLGEVVGKRNALVAVSMTVTTLLCGQLLDRIIFPLNYQVVFALGALGAVMSTYHVSRLKMVKQPVAQIPPPPGPDPRRVQRWQLRLVSAENLRGNYELLRSTFGRQMTGYLLFYTTQFMLIPIFPLAFVRHLDLTDGQISLGSAIFYAVMLVISLRLREFSARFGHRRLLVSSAMAFSLYPLLIGLAWDATLYWVASFVGGAVWALLGASLVNRLIEVTPESDRPAGMALHNLALNVGILVGSLLAPLLVQWIDLGMILVIGAGLRFLSGLALLRWV
jgi:MFS family permease